MRRNLLLASEVDRGSLRTSDAGRCASFSGSGALNRRRQCPDGLLRGGAVANARSIRAKTRRLITLLLTPLVVMLTAAGACVAADRPNILIAISDDQSYPHASAYGDRVVQTHAFDRVAREGMLFHNAFTPAPGCSPMRAAFLTGQYIWQIEEAGTHASSFPASLEVFPESLEEAGYRVGYTGKGWGPGNFRISGRDRNPAGPNFSSQQMDSPPGISGKDYASNFDEFLESQSERGAPFCFWYGGHEPHRGFGKGLGRESGKDPEEVEVPGFLPDNDAVRNDLLDYYFEIEWFDQHLSRMLDSLRERGMLENTLVIVTSDNGMAFPRAKANLYEYGIHMPLAIAWPAAFEGGQSSQELINLLDVTATIYDASGVTPAVEQPLVGKSLLPLLQGEAEWESQAVYSGRERHSSSRFNTLGYPCRCVRTEEYLFIKNFKPERWPAGPGRKYASVRYDAQNQPVDAELGPPHDGYHDIDACPTLDVMIERRDEPETGRLLEASVGKRPTEELYRITEDPACMTNLVDDSEHHSALEKCRRLLAEELERTGDVRQTDPDRGDIWETYPRYSHLRWFPAPDWAQENPDSVPQQDWLDQRRPYVEQ